MNKSVHPVDERLPLGQTFLYGLQHVLAMYAGAVAVPLIVANAIGLSTEDLIYLINADLFTAGIATLIQTLGPCKMGSKLPIVQGVTFAAVSPMIMIGQADGLTAIYGAVIASGLFMFLMSPFFSRLVGFFPPVVTGSVITIIGLSLLPVAVRWAGGGNPAAADFGSIPTLLLSAFVLLQEVTRSAEILVYLHIPSDFLAVWLSAYGFTACQQMSLSPPLPKGRGVGYRSTHPIPVGQSFMPSNSRIFSQGIKWISAGSGLLFRFQFVTGVKTTAPAVTPSTVPTTVSCCLAYNSNALPTCSLVRSCIPRILVSRGWPRV